MSKVKLKSNESALTYYEGLPKLEKERYDAKISVIGGVDPYEMKSDWSNKVELLPDISYPDIVNYLVFKLSSYTLEHLKAYKSLTAYNYFVSGWVREVSTKVLNGHRVVKAKVLHSQCLGLKPLDVWVISEAEGTVLSGHCKCMAGMGEVCSHVAAVLFAVEATVKIRNSKTVTEEKAYWLLPTSLKKVEYKTAADIDFTSASTAKKRLDSAIESTCSSVTPKTPRTPARTNKTQKPTDSEISAFFQELSLCGTKPVVLSLVDEHSDMFVPEADTKNVPMILTDLKEEKCVGMNFKELSEHCESVEISCTQEQSNIVEELTRDQSGSKMWFRYRAGRVTASRMRSVCKTSESNPSLSLVKSVCYPESSKFSTLATKWGCEHEKVAKDKFLDIMSQLHENCVIEDCGFVISTEHPYIGASPDGILKCDCCGSFCVEIKCPYCVRGTSIEEASCLEKNDGHLKLRTDHSYFYQIQTQLGVTNMEQGYFVVWTEKDLHIEVIEFDADMWTEMCEKSKQFFTYSVLPELTGKFYTRDSVCNKPAAEIVCPDEQLSDTPSEQLYCYCLQGEHGEMIACDNDDCQIEWFHYSCVKITLPPKGKWYCPDCRKLKSIKKRRVC